MRCIRNVYYFQKYAEVAGFIASSYHTVKSEKRTNIRLPTSHKKKKEERYSLSKQHEVKHKFYSPQDVI